MCRVVPSTKQGNSGVRKTEQKINITGTMIVDSGVSQIKAIHHICLRTHRASRFADRDCTPEQYSER